MLVKDIIHYLIDDGIQDFVLDAELADIFEEISIQGACATPVSDVRSASFYACGLAEKKNSPIVLVVRKEYLSNTFTGLMESWFQKRRIIVIAIGYEVLNFSIECYKTCTGGQYKIQKLSEFENCFKNSAQDKPSIYLVEENIPYNKFSYGIDIVSLEKELTEECKLFVFSPIASNRSERKNTLYIDHEHKYGMISKFLGHCISQKEKNILLTDTTALKLEMNIFNSRYIDKRFNLIVTGARPSVNITQWLQGNKIDTVFCDSTEIAANEILKADRPTAAFVLTQEDDTVCTQTL